jgi:hypothetical protein
MSGQASGSWFSKVSFYSQNLNVLLGSATPKAIASLAKKQADLTRQGTPKLKFVPTLPAKRKKE